MSSAAGAPFPPRVAREVARELKALQQSALDGIRVTVHDDNIATVHAEIDGPEGTPYEGGVFRMKLLLGRDFPHAAPKGFFLTRIFHPNVAKSGEICVSVLKKDWKASLGLKHVLLVVRCLLIEPYPKSALNEDAGKLLLEDYNAYARHARLFTSIHATPAASSALTSAGKAKQQAQQQQPQQQQQQHEKERQGADDHASKNLQRACTQSATAAALLSDSGYAAAAPDAAVSPTATPTPAPAAGAGAAATDTDTAVISRDSSSSTPPALPITSISASSVDPTSGKNPAGTAGISPAHHTPLATNRSLANADSRLQAKAGNGSAAAAVEEPVAASSTGGGVVKAKGKGENTGRGGTDKKADLRKKSLRRL
ncbi:unnamed protein product [Closterium sp. Naga37s-1]|nr:unnamed protein product [Closterium sp. Naga37s-1]